MFAVDRYLGRTFDQATYNCWDLLREAWEDLTGQDLGARTPSPPSALAMCRRVEADEGQFVRLAEPCSPSIVLLRRPRLVPHVGLFWRRRVLHIRPEGACYERLADVRRGFTDVRFYTCSV